MTEFQDHESEFHRLLQGAPFDDTPRPEHGEALRQQALSRFDKALRADAPLPWWKRAFNQGREIMRRPVPRMIAVATACLVIAAVWLAIPGQQSTAQAFNKLAEAVVAAKTARFQMEVAIEGQPKQKFQAYFLAPGHFRQELANQVNISDFNTGRLMTIIPAEKKVVVMVIKGAPQKDQASNNYFDRLRELLSKKRDAKDDQYERLEDKVIGDKKVAGFRFDSPAETVTLWGDPATGQPVRIETIWSGLPRTEVVMADFEMNVELKEALFDMTPPEGYKVQSFDVDASKPAEKDLVEGFKACSDLGGGEYPETLDTKGIMNLIIKVAVARAMAGGKEFSDEDMQQLMKQSIILGRGFGFALNLPESADAHYAGKGVKRDEKDKPIFWYKPEGKQTYRVLYADLTVKDADAAPKVEGAQRLEKTSKSTKPAKKVDK